MKKKLTKSIENRYLLFLITIIFIIVTVLVIIQRSIHLQSSNANLISKAGNQSMLSQRIIKSIIFIDNNQNEKDERSAFENLKELTYHFEKSQNYLQEQRDEIKINTTVDSLLKASEPYANVIITSGKDVLQDSDSLIIKTSLQKVKEAELPYSMIMNSISNEYLKNAEENLTKLKYTIYILALIAFLILLGEFLFVLVPALKQLFKKNKELLQSNKELSISENKLKASMIELTKLKTDLEAQEKYNKIFIEQAPTAISMLDKEMKYIAVSQQWIRDYKMEGQQIIGRSHYDIFPEIGDDWKENHQKCLKGAIDICDEAAFTRADGSVQWIYWDVRPWYISEDEIGGLLMHTGDITESKEKDIDRIRIQKILDKTNEVARIGTWEVDLQNNKAIWSKVVCEIHEVPHDYEPDLETAINFYKEGKSRDIIKEALKQAVENGTPYDIEVELITASGAAVWTRAMGQSEIVEGECTRLFGVFQDINNIKHSQIALHKAHTELKAIFNSGAVAIVATEINGIISQFNHGAEVLTGYSASEMIGLQRPKIFHLQEEFDAFRIDIAKLYNKNPVGLSPQEELAKHNAYDTREWTYRRKDGSTIAVQLTLTSIKDEKGELIGFLGISTDISEKKITEYELLRKNKLLNFAEEITLMGNWQWDTVADKVEWSNNLYNIFKLDKETKKIKFDTYFNFVHPDDKDSVTKYFSKTVDEKRLHSFTHRIIAGDGTLKTIQLLGEVITNDKDEVIEMIGTCQDITATKAAERELFDAHTQLKAIFNSGPLAIVSVDNDGIIKHFNYGAELLLGYSASEMIGLKVPEIYHLEEELLAFKEDIAKKYNKDLSGFSPYLELAKNNESDTREWTFRKKDGSTFPVELTLTAINNKEDEKIGFLAVANDISDRKRAQNELLRKNQILNFAEKITLMGNWQADIINNSVKWSTNLYHIFQLEESTSTTLDTYLSFTHPEDKERVAEHMRKTVEEKFFTDIVHRIQLTDGTIKIVQLLAQVITNDWGRVTEIIGTCQDVTAQRMAENKFRGLLESAPDAMVIVNEKGKIQLINKQAEILFGYHIDELFDKPVEILIPKRFTGNHNHESQRNGFFGNPNVRIMGGGNQKELFGINKKGDEMPIQISLSPLQTEEGLLVSAAIRDITVQKSAERRIIQAKENLETLTRHLSGQNKQLEDFAHITSHNLRAPVSNLNALLHLYDISESEEERKLLFEKFEIVINHLTSTLNTLIEALKTKEVSEKDLEFIDFEETLNKTKEILSGQIISTNSIITNDFSKVAEIEYHKMYLESIFLNLVSNAIKYRSPDQYPEIHIETMIINKKVHLTFRDNGLGIDLAKHGHKLFGLNKTFHRHPDAKGVGLYLTKIQVNNMGGSIFATSEVNKGSVFTIIFNNNSNEKFL